MRILATASERRTPSRFIRMKLIGFFGTRSTGLNEYTVDRPKPGLPYECE